MPLKRTSRAPRETPAARALRAAVADEFDAMLARIPDDAETPSQRHKGEKRATKFAARVVRDGLDSAMAWHASKYPPESPGPRIDPYAAHHASAVRDTATARATRAAPAPERATVTAGRSKPKARRRGLRAGHVGYIDPRLIDDDDWED